MKHKKPTREHLMIELAEARRLIDELRKSALDHERIEETIQGSENRFRSLIQNSLDMIFILDGKGIMVYESPSVESILGYQPGYLIGKSHFEFIHPDDLERVANDLNEVYLKINPGIPTGFRCRKADGNWSYLEAIGQNLLEDPAVNGIVITARDITERKRAEEEFRQVKDFNETLIQASPAFFVAFNPEGKTIMMNEAMLQALGYSLDEVLGKDYLTTFIPESDREMLSKVFQTLKQAKNPTLNENFILTREGKQLLVEWHGRFVFKKNDELDFFFGVGIDITERKQVEEELMKHREHLEALVKERTASLTKAIVQLEKEIEERKRAEDALRMNEEIYRIHFSLSTDVMFTIDEKFTILSVTPNMERILGYKPQELVGKTFLEVELLHSDDMGRALEDAKNIVSGGVSRHPIYRFITKDGRTKFGEVSGVPLIKEGQGTTVISVARDVTERIEYEKFLVDTLDRFRTHFSLSDDVMFYFDHMFQIKNVSPNVERILGYKPEDIIGKPVYKIGVLSPEYMDEALDEALHLLSGQTINSSIYEFIAKDGKRKFGEVSSSPILRDGRVVEVICVAREITHQIDNAKFVQQSRATAQALLNACTDFMALIDISGTILQMNKAASENLGRSVQELMGTCLLDHMPPEAANRRKIYFEQVINSGKAIQFEDENRGRLFHSSLFPVNDDLGKVTRIAIHARDITDLKQAFFKGRM